MADNFLCTHCGKNGDTKEGCDKLKEAKNRHVELVKQKVIRRT